MGYTPKTFTRHAVKIIKSDIINTEDVYRRQFIKFINTLKCPICQAGLDGSIGNEANLYCRLSPDEYHAQYIQGTFLPLRDSIRVDGFEIDHNQISGNKYRTVIWFIEEKGFSLPSRKLVMEHEGEAVFSALDFNYDAFINKMELYDVFS